METPNSRLVGDVSLVRGELRVTNHHTDPGTPCYGQQRAEEVLECKMSGWMTNKFVCTEKLRGFACATHQASDFAGVRCCDFAGVRYCVRSGVGAMS